jgi:asparagine synthase (glutamine-hydrolysing)
MASQQSVKVLLDGQGADEVLAGYNKYYHWYWQELYSSNSKNLLQQEINAARNNGIIESFTWKNKLAASFPSYAAVFLKRNRVKKQLQHPGLSKEFLNSFGESYYTSPHLDQLNGVLYYNTLMNGLEELLRYADRNSMAHSTEVRLPFLHHELVQFIFSLPSNLKIRDGWTKWILRKTMDQRLPAAITWRKEKVGFEPPQQDWMKQDKLQEYTQEAKRALVKQGILKEAVLQKKIQPLDAHAAENFDWRYLAAGSLLR